MQRISTTSTVVSYEDKTAELKSLVSQEAKNLQGFQELKETVVREIQALGEQKSTLLNTIYELREEALKAQDHLMDVKVRETGLVDTSKRELQENNSILGQIQRTIVSLQETAGDLQSVVSEIQAFIEKKKDARERYLSEQQRLSKAKELHKSVLAKTEKEKKEITNEKKEMDKSKKSIADMSSKLSRYASEVRLATKFLNEKLAEGGMPVEYELPPKKITIPFT